MGKFEQIIDVDARQKTDSHHEMERLVLQLGLTLPIDGLEVELHLVGMADK